MIISINFGSTKFTLDVNPSDSILDIKYLIHEEKGISPFSQKLLYQDESLEDEKTLSDYNIQNLSILHLLNSPANDPIVLYEEFVSRLIEGNATVSDYAKALSFFLLFIQLFMDGSLDITFIEDDRIKIIELSIKFCQFRKSYNSQAIEYIEKEIILPQKLLDFLNLNAIEVIKEEEEEDEDNEKVDASNDKDNEDGNEDETNGNDDTGDDKDNEDGDEDEVNGKDDSGDDNNEEEGDGEDNIQETLN
jgi:hypothetical protein